MYLNLVENGIDSLKQGLSLYREFLVKFYDQEKNDFSILKLSIICLHISIETLSKKILADIDELLIYDITSKEKFTRILEEMNLRLNNNYKNSLDEVLIANDTDIETISYSKSIERIKIIFTPKLKQKQYDDLQALSKLRNKIIHFGINKEFDYYKIVSLMNRILKIFKDFYYPILKDKYLDNKNDLPDEILDTISLGKLVEAEALTLCFELEINDIHRFLQDLSAYMNTKLNPKGITMEIFEDTNLSLREFLIGFFDQEDEGVYLGIRSESVAKLDSTFFIISECEKNELENSIYAVVDHAESSEYIYIFKNLRSTAETFKFNVDKMSHKFWQKNKNWDYIELNTQKVSERVVKDFIFTNTPK